MSSVISVFLTNLGKYNEGELLGEWVSLPIEEDKLAEVRKRIGINKYYEEEFLTDWECPFQEVNSLIGEYTSISYLNEIAEQLDEIPETDYQIINALSDYYNDIGSILKAYHNSNYIVHYGCSSMEAVAQSYLEESGIFHNLPDIVERYFDFESYGRDMEIEGSYTELEDGTIIEILY